MADDARLPSRNMADIEASANTKDACMRSVQGKDSARFEVRMNPHPADRERPRRVLNKASEETKQAMRDRCHEQGHEYENCCSSAFQIYQRCKWCGAIR